MIPPVPATGSQSHPSQANGTPGIMLAPWSCHGSPGPVHSKAADNSRATRGHPVARVRGLGHQCLHHTWTQQEMAGWRHERFPGLLWGFREESGEPNVRRGSSLHYLGQMRKARATSHLPHWELGSSIPGSCMALPLNKYLLICGLVRSAHPSLRMWAQYSAQSLWGRFRLASSDWLRWGPSATRREELRLAGMPSPVLHTILPTFLCKEYFSNACAGPGQSFLKLFWYLLLSQLPPTSSLSMRARSMYISLYATGSTSGHTGLEPVLARGWRAG